jgi:tripartite ATP-independent transporter DctP family solute receptor
MSKINTSGGIMMFKMSKRLLLCVLMICVLIQASFIFAAVNPTAKNPIVVKLGITDPPTVKLGDAEVFGSNWAGMLAFRAALETYTQGRVKVELYPNGRLGDNKSTLEQVINGNLLVTNTTDGVLATFYKQIQALSAPYVFEDVTSLWNVLDGPFGRKLFNDMAAKTGIRVLTTYNAGLRSYGNTKKVIKVPADMKGLKMRIQDSPIFMEMVKACGASPTPVAWMETYSALQTGVVDGMEHGPVCLLQMSFHEVLKYYTLDNHTFCIAMFVTNEKFLKSLPADIREAFLKAGKEASIAARGFECSINGLALEEFKKKGVKIYVPTPAERKLWEKTREPVLNWLKKNVDAKLVDELLKTVKQQSKKKK